MSLRHAYAPMFPEFDSFLFASVGEEVDGVPLSVLSALSRLDLDPRDEAARLSHLTKETAADQLARMIAGLSDEHLDYMLSRVPLGRLATTDDRRALEICRAQPGIDDVHLQHERICFKADEAAVAELSQALVEAGALIHALAPRICAAVFSENCRSTYMSSA